MREKIGVFVGAVLIVGMAVLSLGLNYTRQMNAIEARFEAANKQSQLVFDAVRRTLSGRAGVTKQYRDAILAVVSKQVDGRTGGSLSKSIQEAAPGLDPGLYRDLANAVEVGMQNRLRSQSEINACVEAHRKLRLDPIAGLFVGGRSALVWKPVVSSEVAATFESGTDNTSADPFAN